MIDRERTAPPMCHLPKTHARPHINKKPRLHKHLLQQRSDQHAQARAIPRRPWLPFLQDNINLCTVGHTPPQPLPVIGSWSMAWDPTPSIPPPWPWKRGLTKLIQWIRVLDGREWGVWPWGNVSFFSASLSRCCSLKRSSCICMAIL